MGYMSMITIIMHKIHVMINHKLYTLFSSLHSTGADYPHRKYIFRKTVNND